MKNILKPILVLTAICLFMSAALAFTNQKTAPIIAETERKQTEAAQKEVLPDADTLSKLELSDLPATVKEVYKAENGAGFVFTLLTKGYGGDMKLICGIDAEGKIVACKTLIQNETKGLGTKTTEPKFTDQFVGKDAALEGVEAISGATISSKAYILAIEDALAAYELAKEAE